jgi:DNA invertase Pin-like site-specific DNA recombinase
MTTLRVAGYIRVSTDEQSKSGLGLEAQRDAIQRRAELDEWEVRWFIDRATSAGNINRPALNEALGLLSLGKLDALVVAKLDRLSRSVVDLSGLLQRAEEESWGIVLLDFDLDTTTPTGRLVAHVLSAVAEFERDRIRERTREALAVAKARGIRLGRPRSLPEEVVDRIRSERADGATLSAIAEGLNEDAAATAHGGQQWWPSTVRAVLRRSEVGAQ